MQFSRLFAPIADKITYRDVNLVKMDFLLFRRKVMSRHDFAKKLRLIVGDHLLRFALMMKLKGNNLQPQVRRTQDAAADRGHTSTRAPKSPSIPFPELLAAIANKIASRDMILIKRDYELFMRNMMSRDDFVKKLRLIAGDRLLMFAIMNRHSKELPKTRQDPETKA